MSNLTELLGNYKVVIPPIQRDYAQGRNTEKIRAIRKKFVGDIYKVLSDDSEPEMELDFIYGDVTVDSANGGLEIKTFKPLDGQQRLTTLYLVYWFIANKLDQKTDGRSRDVIIPLLKKFTYATRASSRNFCEWLMDFTMDFSSDKKVDEQIKNEPWFLGRWKNDPTIKSMLVMLSEIEEQFVDVDESFLEKIASEASRIKFHLLPMSDLGLPDDLYIKMNARGKLLTDFENFKSSFSSILSSKLAEEFKEKVDKEWTDLFWNLFKNEKDGDIAKFVDKGFLNFFWFITDILIRKNDIKCEEEFWLDRIKEVYKNNDAYAVYLFRCLDLFARVEKLDVNPFDLKFYVKEEDFEINKVRLFYSNAKPNLFYKCAETYGAKDFAIREQLLLYAFIQIELEDKSVKDNFYRQLRNLLDNATDKNVRNENLNELYKTVDRFIEGIQDPDKLEFTEKQLNEEKEKEEFILLNPGFKEIIYRLEDHIMLRGSIEIFDLNQSIEQLGSKFLEIFKPGNNYFETSRAMLVHGFYPQEYRNRLYRFGNQKNSSWQEILRSSDSRKNFDNTKKILNLYLKDKIEFPGITDLEAVELYLKPDIIDKDFNYYYLKYNSFVLWKSAGSERQTEGFYYWENLAEKPYEGIMLFKTNFRGRSWKPFLLEVSNRVENCSIGNFYDDGKITFSKEGIILQIDHFNEGYCFSAPEGEEESLSFLQQLIAEGKLNQDGFLMVPKNEDGIDWEDRIEACVEFLDNLQF